MSTARFTTQLEENRIIQAIQQAELRTSGEIRVFITRRKATDPIAAAQAEFLRLKMDETREHNGVLIFVAPRSRNFAIIGDEGVHARCGQTFWTDVSAEMSKHFQQGAPTEAIVHAINKAGELLSNHFPRQADDRNELSDKVEHD